ncbi:MAG: cysteine hydrolase [Armatimonadetes bacterium]|nr:cysteine hydrolase [Armatimonadota bacterium]
MKRWFNSLGLLAAVMAVMHIPLPLLAETSRGAGSDSPFAGKPYAEFLSEHPGQDRWAYHVALGKSPGLRRDINPKQCALVVIDMEEICLEQTGFMGAVGGFSPELWKIFEKRRDKVVWPNLEKLVAFFREKGMPVIYTHIGDDGVHPRLKPREDEVVTKKPHTGGFLHTDLDKILRRKGINTLFMTGVCSSHCVLFTTLEALNHGYQTITVEDANIDPRPDHQQAAMTILGLHGFVTTTEGVISDYPWKMWVDTKPLPAEH